MKRNLRLTSIYAAVDVLPRWSRAMKRLLLVPAAALAILAFAAPASAQALDPDTQAQYSDVSRAARRSHSDVTRIRRNVEHCRPMPDVDEISLLAGNANDVSRRAAGLAWQVPGERHVTMLNVASGAESDFWYLTTLSPAPQCYQPPAE